MNICFNMSFPSSSQLAIFIKVHLIFICSITAKKNAHFPHDLGF